jgi:hypothetical protein
VELFNKQFTLSMSSLVWSLSEIVFSYALWLSMCLMLTNTSDIQASANALGTDQSVDTWQRDTDASAKAQNVSFCGLFTRPHRYNQVVVRTEAILLQARGALVDAGEPYLYDPRCNRRDRFVLVDYDASYKASLQMENALNQIISQAGERNVVRIKVVVLGKFEDDNDKGYGHLDGFRARFVIRKIERVKPVSHKTPWPKGEGGRE